MKNKKTIYLAIVVVVIGVILGLAYNYMENKKRVDVVSFEKSNPGEKAKEYELFLSAGDEILDKEYKVKVYSRKLSLNEQQEKLDEALGIWRKKFLDENISQNYVNRKLNVFDELNAGLVKIDIAYDYKLIAPSGIINYDKVSESGTMTEIKATLRCEESKITDSMYIVLYPPDLSKSEEIINEVDELILKENDSTDEEFVLPSEVAGVTLSWKQKRDNTGILIMALSLLAAVGILYGNTIDQKKDKERRNRQLEKEYILLLRQLTVLTRAGMTVMASFERIAESYIKRQQSGVIKKPVLVYEELIVLLRKVKDGCGEREAYQSLCEQCPPLCYRKLSTLLIRNYKKGSAGLSSLMDELLEEEFLKRKMTLKKNGEELSTKLLLPMMIMLGLVMAIVTVPAVWSFNM